MKEVGTITHYYGKIGVAIVKLSDTLKVGDKIKVEGNKTEFEQEIDSIQMEHAPIQEAQKGSEVGIKMKEKADEGATVYKIEE